MDAFDALREADENRQEWIKAARLFTRLLDRVVDKASVAGLERMWQDEAANPLAPASRAWLLVTWARDAVCEDLPLTFAEAADNDDLTTEDVLRETRKWQKARLERDEEVEREVNAYLDGEA